MVTTILVFFVAIFVLPSVDGVKAVGEGGVGRLQLVDLLFAVPDLKTKTTMTDLGEMRFVPSKQTMMRAHHPINMVMDGKK